MDRHTRFRGIQQKLAESLSTDDAKFLEEYLRENEGEQDQAPVQEPGQEQLPEMFEDENGNLFAATGQTDESGNPILIGEDGQAYAFGGEQSEEAPVEEPVDEQEYEAAPVSVQDDDEVSVNELAHQFPDLAHEIDAEERGMEESDRDHDIVSLKMENKLLKSRLIAEAKIQESGLPAGYVTMAELVGKSPEVMDAVINSKINQLETTARMIESAVGAHIEPSAARGATQDQCGLRIRRGALMPR